MVAAIADELDLTVSDVSGQKVTRVSRFPRSRTVGEFLSGILPRMELPEADSQGRPVIFRARLEREGRYLHPSEVVGEALLTDDRISLQPNIDAGAGVHR